MEKNKMERQQEGCESSWNSLRLLNLQNLLAKSFYIG